MNRLSGPGDVVTTASEDETLELGALLGARLRGGDVVHLHGDLGAGKTHFAKGLGAGLGIDPAAIRSPTFAFVDVHPAGGRGLGFVHADLYRVADAAELPELGLQELPGPDRVVAIEWAERLGAGPEPAVRVTIADLGGDLRRVEIRWTDPGRSLGDPPGPA